jgi:hypothetical protein
MPEMFDEFLNKTGNVYCGNCDGNMACCYGRCLLAAWEHAFHMALALSIKMLFDRGGGRGATNLVYGREMTTSNLVQAVDNDNVDEVPVVNEEVSLSNQPTGSFIAQRCPAAKGKVALLSNDYPPSLVNVIVEGNNDERVLC